MEVRRAKPGRVARIHRRLCQARNCPQLATLDYNDPCIGCPEGHFGPYMRAGCNGELPSKVAMARNAVAAAVSAVKNPARVSPEEKARRLEICEACPHLIRAEARNGRAPSHRCAKCGCFLKWKTALETWHCPIKKW